MNIHEALEKYGDDSQCDLKEFDAEGIRIEIEVASRGGERWTLKASNVIWADFAPAFTLGSVRFGGLEILPKNYWDTRNADYGGEKDQYRVIKFRDIENKFHHIVLYGQEVIKKS